MGLFGLTWTHSHAPLSRADRSTMPMKEFVVVGRRRPTEKNPAPPVYRMRLFASNSVVAKSRFFYYIKKQKKVKPAAGEILACHEIFEAHPTKLKNFGVWLRYDSRSGTHNMYKEYRATCRTDAVDAMYMEMAGRHRARPSVIHVLKVAQVAKEDLRRGHMKEIMEDDLKFPFLR